MCGKPGLLLALCLVATGACADDEEAACTETTYDWSAQSAAALRTIAGRCNTRPFTELNYHRAYYLDLLGEDAAAAGLISYSVADSQPSMESFGVHMLLVEQLAPLYFPSGRERVAFLNSEYELMNEIAELWLHGYGTLATRLSERHSHNAPSR
jgi:hypothetical protein